MKIEIMYSIQELPDVAKKLISSIINKSNIWLFRGEMGAGKTTLVKEICRQLHVENSVQSPTFSLINEYKTKEGEIIYHFDLYRLKNLKEAIDIGIEEYIDSNRLCLIEWPEQAEELWEMNHVNIEIFHIHENTRKLVCHWTT